MSVVDSLLIEIGVDASQVADGINQSRNQAQGFANWFKKLWQDNVDSVIEASGKKAQQTFSAPPTPPKTQETKAPNQELPKVPDQEPKKPEQEPPKAPKDVDGGFFNELKKAFLDLKDGLREATGSNTDLKPIEKPTLEEVPKTPVKPSEPILMFVPKKPEPTPLPEKPKRKDFETTEDYDDAMSKHRETVKEIRKEDERAEKLWHRKSEPALQYNTQETEKYNVALAEYKDKLDEIEQVKKRNAEATKEYELNQKRLNQSQRDGSNIVSNLTSKLRDLAAGYLTIRSLLTRGEEIVRLRDLSRELRISVEELDTWGRAFKMAGYSSESAYDALGKIKNGLRDVSLTGRSETIGMLRYLGVELNNTDGSLKTSGEILKATAKRLRELDPGNARKFAEMAGFGRESISLMLDTKVSLEEFLKVAQKGAVSEELAENVKVFQREWGKLATVFMKVGNVILKYVVPPMTAIVGAIADVIDALTSCDAGVLVLLGGFAALTGKIGAVIGAFTGVAKMLRGILGIANNVGAAIGALFNIAPKGTGLFAWLGRLLSLGGRLNPVTGAILLLGGAIKNLWQFFNEGNSILDWFLKKIGIAEEKVKSFKQWVKDFFGYKADEVEAQAESEKNLVSVMMRQVSHPDVAPVANNSYSSSTVNNRNQNAQFNTTINMQGDVKDRQALQKSVEEGVSRPFRSWTHLADSGNF